MLMISAGLMVLFVFVIFHLQMADVLTVTQNLSGLLQ